MDYGGYNVAAPERSLLNLNNVRYKTLQDATADVGLMPHGVLLDWDVFTRAVPPPGDDKFADPATSDITLRRDSKAIDAGIALPVSTTVSRARHRIWLLRKWQANPELRTQNRQVYGETIAEEARVYDRMRRRRSMRK